MSLQGAAGADELIFYVNGRKIIEKHADPEQMLLSYLRKRRILFLFFLEVTQLKVLLEQNSHK